MSSHGLGLYSADTHIHLRTSLTVIIAASIENVFEFVLGPQWMLDNSDNDDLCQSRIVLE